MTDTIASKNRALVLKAFDTLFNKRDYAAAEQFWSPHYIQHSAHIAPGRDGLFALIKSLPPEFRWEPGVIMAEGDLVMVHGRYSGRGVPTNWIAVDILRVKDGVFVEHWDVLQDEVSEAASKSGLTHVRYCLFVLRTSLPVAVGRNPGLPRPQQPPSGERDDAAELVDALLAGLVSVCDPKVMDVITRAVASSAASRTARSQHLSAGKDVMAHELVEKT